MKRLTDIFMYDKYGNKPWKNDCVNCLLSYTLKCIIIISPLRGKCKHMTVNYDGKTVFWYSKSGVIFPVVFVLSNFFASIIHLFSILSKCKVNRLDCLLELHDQLLILNTVTWTLIVLIKSIVRVHELNHLSCIFENKKFYGLKTIIGEKHGRYIYCINHINVLLAGACVILFGFVAFMDKGKAIFNYHDISLFVCQGIQVSIASQVSQKLVLMRVLYNSVGRAVQTRLNEALTDDSIRRSYLEKDLKKFIHLYLECKEVINKICDFINPTVIIWLTSHIALTVINFYAFIQLVNIQPVYLTIFGQIRTLVSLLVLVSIFRDCQQILKENRKTLDFLFVFSLSKLSHFEGLLVEMLIETLTTQSPKVHASYIVVITLELTCSVAGAIVTYLLVCLQFKPFN